MGMFSWNCKACGHPLLSTPATEENNKWMSKGVALSPGEIVKGTYDGYGNLYQTYYHGDVSVLGDEKKIFTEHVYNTSNWLLSLPCHAFVQDAQSNVVSEQWFYYDNNTSFELFYRIFESIF